LPDEDSIPVQISDTITRGQVKPTYPVVQYPHNRDTGGDAIANGFVYRGKLIPALRDKLVFGDITTGRIWYANRADVLAADDGNPTTMAPFYEMDAGRRQLTEQKYGERGGQGEALPGMAMVAGRGRVDLRFAVDNDGELYILTKSDGMIRKMVGARAATAPTITASVPTQSPGQSASSQPATIVRNPIASTPASIAAGKRAYDANCLPCHGNVAQGTVKAAMTISIIEEQRGKQPPDLTDEQWDHGSSDPEVFAVIKRGVPPTMMPGFDGRVPDDDIRNIVNYLPSLAPKR
jgi:mono/diheme cytochrome c family protein